MKRSFGVFRFRCPTFALPEGFGRCVHLVKWAIDFLIVILNLKARGSFDSSAFAAATCERSCRMVSLGITAFARAKGLGKHIYSVLLALGLRAKKTTCMYLVGDELVRGYYLVHL